MMDGATRSEAGLLAALTQALGVESVIKDAHDEARDIFDTRMAPICMARCSTVEDVQRVVQSASAHHAPIVSRGAGASYTLGYSPTRPGAVMIDTSALNRIIAIDEAAMTVTVEAGVTWAQLDEALKAKGLRTPFWGPYSGLKATIGGSLSQHAISMGSGLWETSAQSVIALDIIDGRGEMFSTAASDTPFFRTHGPDLCGLFLGDCGSLGVKVRATLKVFRRPTHVAACSFSFKRFDDFSAAMGAVSSRALCSEILGLDPEIQKGFLGSLTTKSAMAAARAIWSTAPGPFEAAGALMRAGFAARDFMSGEDFVAYFTAEGWSKAEVAAKITSVRALVGRTGVEVSNAGALALRGNPFLPLAPVAPLSGNRWMPTHGVFSIAAFLDFHRAFEAWKAKHAAAMAAHALTMTRMFVPVGAQAIIYEPTFYWPDSRTPAQRRLAPSDHLARITELPDNPETRAFVFSLRRELTELMAAHGAQHFQLGKWYRYFSLLNPTQRAMIEALKRTLDPQGLMNPDALELPSP